ncbi:hypothetical protein HC891_12970 [Candidatus Gracilibacteria bacterium]|nr:hypothetical protein [Candidatus Gracilibacteria bacterium]
MLRADPAAIAGSFWNVAGYEAGGRVDGTYETLWGRDHGFVEIPLSLPTDLHGALQGLRVQLEAAARPALVTQSTVGRAQPSDLTIALNGVEIATQTLPDLHANARGALSMINRLGAGQHGELIDVEVPAQLLPVIEAHMRRRASSCYA